MRCLLLTFTLLFAYPIAAQKVLVQRVGPADGVRVNDIRSILFDSRGILWVGTYGDGLLYLKQGQFVNPVESNLLTGPYILEICESDIGEILVRSERGLCRFDGRKWTEHDEQQGDCQAYSGEGNPRDTLQADVGTVYEARNEGLFIKGLLDSASQQIKDVNGFLDDTIQSLAFGNNDALWIATKNNGLLRRSVGERTCTAFGSSRSWTAESGRDLTVYSLRSDGALERWQPGKGIVQLGPISLYIRALVTFDEKYLLVNDNDGRLLQTPMDSLDIFRELSGSIQVSQMVVDRFGTAWIVDESGNVSTVEALDGGLRWRRTYARIPVKGLIRIFPGDIDGLIVVSSSSIGELKDNRYRELATSSFKITAVGMDSSGELWGGTENGRIFNYNHTSGFRVLGEGSTDLVTRPIRFVEKVNTGVLFADDVWLYEAEMTGDATRLTSVSRLFDLPPGGVDQSYYHAGSVYFLAGDQICTVPLSAGLAQRTNPVLFLTDVLLPSGSIAELDYGRYLMPFLGQSKEISLPFQKNEIVFSWEAIAAQPGDVFYEYRLYEDDQWHSLGGRNQVQIASLSPGTYAFDIRACDSRMNCSTLDKPWVFTIGKPWWQLWWIWTLGALVVLASGILVVKQRIRAIRLKANRAIELARAKTRALELEQKARQLQMRPHFVSNALNAIQSRVINGKPEEASDELVKFSRMMRGMLDASRKDKIALEEELQLLKMYVGVVGLSTGIPPTLTVIVEDEAEIYDIEIPPMLLQPIIENCIEHGGPHIRLNAEMHGKFLHVEVSDDGPGFKEGDVEKTASVAMKLIRERLEAAGGAFEIFNENDGGARVRLHIPV